MAFPVPSSYGDGIVIAQDPIAEVSKLLEDARKRAFESLSSLQGTIAWMSGEERDRLFRLCAVPGTAYTIEGIAGAVTYMIAHGPK